MTGVTLGRAARTDEFLGNVGDDESTESREVPDLKEVSDKESSIPSSVGTCFRLRV